MKDPAMTALEALGHVKVANDRCTARYKESDNPPSGPRNPPVWCDLKAGHEGPHKHLAGHRAMEMSREHLIEMKPLPDLCQKCGTKWPCRDAVAVLNAFAVTTERPCEGPVAPNVFELEIWEKKTITVIAENFTAAVQLVPSDCSFESVRKQGDVYEDRLTEYDCCLLCGQPMLQDKFGPVDRWAKVELNPDEVPFLGDCAHESCAVSHGRKILETMPA